MGAADGGGVVPDGAGLGDGVCAGSAEDIRKMSKTDTRAFVIFEDVPFVD
jgi:hypothetical protein